MCLCLYLFSFCNIIISNVDNNKLKRGEIKVKDYGVDESFLSERKTNEKSEIGFYSLMASAAVIGYFIISKVYAEAVKALGLRRLITGTHLANESFSLVITVIAILVPFFIAAFFEKKKTKNELLPLDKPKKPLLMVLAVPAGVAVCIVGSLVTNYISLLFSFSGITLSQPSMASPVSGYELFIYFIRLTITAAIIEEICFRGIIMQPLRKYGNMFAIIASSFVFAMMHCNLVQAPSAFISAIGIGYFTIATGTLWTGILIHFVNNLIVAVTQYVLSASGEEAGLALSYTLTEIFLCIGAVALLLFFLIRKTGRLDSIGESTLTRTEKFKAYYLSIPMIITVLIIIYLMRAFITL